MTEKTVVKKIHADSVLPTYGTAGAAGGDVCAYLKTPNLSLQEYDSGRIIFVQNDAVLGLHIVLGPNERVLIPTGLRISPGRNTELQVRPRSGLPLKKGLLITNSPGTVDEDYMGELGIGLVNVGTNPVAIAHGDRIAQVLLAPVLRLTDETTVFLDHDVTMESLLGTTDRGTGGFGSTGR